VRLGFPVLCFPLCACDSVARKDKLGLFSVMQRVSRLRVACAWLSQHAFVLSFVVLTALAICFVISASLATPGTIVSTRTADTADDPVLGNSTENVFWFSQVSDIHTSVYLPETLAHFQEFCSKTVNIVQPSFVIASGDLTDGFVSSSILRPGQLEVIIVMKFSVSLAKRYNGNFIRRH